MFDEWLRHILFVSMRWLHIVSTTLLVGGTLFFEFVVPLAVEDFTTEQQLTFFGRARWVFRRVVWPSAFLLIVSGLVSVFRSWESYSNPSYELVTWMAVVHAALGIGAIAIALWLTVPRRPPDRPVTWMRINLGILLIAILAATVARHARLIVDSRVRPTTQKASPDSVRGAILGPAGRNQ